MSASDRRKVLLHLPIPDLRLQLFEPIDKLLTFLIGETSDGVLDGFLESTLTLT